MKNFILFLLFFYCFFTYSQDVKKLKLIAQTQNILIVEYEDSINQTKAVFMSDVRLSDKLEVARFVVTFMPQNEIVVMEQKRINLDSSYNVAMPCVLMCPSETKLSFCTFMIKKIEIIEEGKIFYPPCSQQGAVINKVYIWLEGIWIVVVLLHYLFKL